MSKEIPSQEVKPTEATPAVVEDETTDEVTDESKNDPFDTMSDEEVRAEAKKLRGILGRKDKKEAPATPAPKQEESQFVTREELYAENRKEAARLLTEITGEDDPEADMKAAMEENWDEVMTYFVSRRGQSKPEDIVKDAKAAYILWQHETGGAPNDSARQLQGTTIGTGAGGAQKAAKPTTDVSDDSRFSKPKTPDKWYPKKD